MCYSFYAVSPHIYGSVLDSTGASLTLVAVGGTRYVQQQITGNRTNYSFA